MFNIDWYIISSAFSSEPAYAILVSIPFLFSFLLLLLFGLCTLSGGPNFGVAVCFILSVCFFLGCILTIPSMKNVQFKTEFLPTLSQKLFLKNKKEQSNSSSALWQLINMDNQSTFIDFRKKILENTPIGLNISYDKINVTLQKYYEPCINDMKINMYPSTKSILDIQADIDNNNKLCATKAAKQLIEDSLDANKLKLLIVGEKSNIVFKNTKNDIHSKDLSTIKPEYKLTINNIKNNPHLFYKSK